MRFLIAIAAVGEDVGSAPKFAILYPSFVLKDENKAAYYLSSVDYVRGNRDTPPAKILELAAKTSKGSKKRNKKSFKATKGSKEK